MWQEHCSPTHMQVTTHRRNSDRSETPLGGGDHSPGSQDMVARKKEAAATRVSGPVHRPFLCLVPSLLPANSLLPYKIQLPVALCRKVPSWLLSSLRPSSPLSFWVPSPSVSPAIEPSLAPVLTKTDHSWSVSAASERLGLSP